MSYNLYEIDHFQLDNLLFNRVPFKLISLSESLSSFYSGLQLMHLKASEVVLPANLESVLSYFETQNLTKDFALVFICSNGEVSKAIQEKVYALGYINVYFIKNGITSLKNKG